ncbi:hypothetical protein GCM10020258_17680 [Sphingomonas yabuuchiae]
MGLDPSVRDRNTGLWQGVTLAATGPAVIGDPQVVTTLPKPDNSVADVEIAVPVTNNGQTPVTTTVRAVFDDVVVEKPVTVAPGQTIRAVLSPFEFPQLSVKNPRLWWPNGYGDPALHDLALTAAVDGALSDSKGLRFGMRQVTYDLSLFDGDGDLERVTLDLNRVRGGPKVVDTSHAGIRKTGNGWAMSFMPGGDQSAAVAKVTDDPRLAPYMTLRVNGVRIAARGGNIGMDDFMKRVDRAHLEPFFRLHRDAHLNIIRNWVGQNTEESFFDLADEYGLMVLSDFWESTQDYNMEAEDPQLFLANAADVVRRYRNHPSIVAWFGRNEGVPQPILNNGLDTLLRTEDGTRLYMPSSNAVNLQGSGPYNWRPPVEYFTTHAKGFSVEVGTPSLPTLESWKRTIPAEADRWPIGDVWAYHDWHQTGNGAVKTYMDVLERRFGPATGLEDFERKAQMMEYESYRAIFEGMNAGLWTENSGRMLWMTQPAWPSSAWQIFSSDYDTHAAFYGVKKAAEPIHVQMNLPDHRVVLVNNTRDALKGVQVRAKIVGLDGRTESEQEAKIVAGAEGDASARPRPRARDEARAGAGPAGGERCGRAAAVDQQLLGSGGRCGLSRADRHGRRPRHRDRDDASARRGDARQRHPDQWRHRACDRDQADRDECRRQSGAARLFQRQLRHPDARRDPRDRDSLPYGQGGQADGRLARLERHRDRHGPAPVSRVILTALAALTLAAPAAAQTAPKETDAQRWTREWEERLHNDFAYLARYRSDNAKLSAPVAGQPRIVFMGDSITEGWAGKMPQFFTPVGSDAGSAGRRPRRCCSASVRT